MNKLENTLDIVWEAPRLGTESFEATESMFSFNLDAS